MKKYLLVASLIFALVPLNSVFAVTYTDPLYGVSSAIEAQTQVLKDALLQQQMAYLSPECVSRLRAQIAAEDTGLKKIEQAIADENARYAGKPHDAGEAISHASTINSLGSLWRTKKEQYNNWIIRVCSQEKQQASQPANPAPAPALTLDQQCKNSFGIHSIGYGASKCVCETGYQWASDGKSCAPAPDTNAVSVNVSPFQPLSGGGSVAGSGGSGSTGGSMSCDRMVMGQMTHLGTMAGRECEAAWSKAVEGAQKKNGSFVAVAVPHPVEVPEIDEATSAALEAGSVAGESTGDAQENRPSGIVSRIWTWFTGLFGR
ncbi:MAG: calcium-binding EGF-like domain-containing protein [bacterium]|nr:calcium-binding EGF-like domain-containing protein [bacterium]